MALGQIQLVVLAFPENRFNGEIRNEIQDLVDKEIVSIVDAMFITKDADGNVAIVELEEMTDDPDVQRLQEALDEQLDLLSDEDAEAIAEQMPNNSSALGLVFEHTWIRGVRNAIIQNGGILVADIHVPGLAVQHVLASLDSES